jgi:two-component system sensor histidine kinase DegS
VDSTFAQREGLDVEDVRAAVIATLRDTQSRLCSLLARAERLNAAAMGEQSELEHFVASVALHSSLLASEGSRATVEGAVLDLDAMRRDMVALARDTAAASVMLDTIRSLTAECDGALDHLESNAWSSVTLNATDARVQAAIIAAREEERRRLAREIHDGPAQVLTNADLAMQIVEQTARQNPEALPEEIGRVRELLRSGAQEIRRFMSDLRPTMLQEQGLGPTLHRTAEVYRRFFGRTVHVDIADPLPPLPLDDELALFRITQEALQNVHKHAGASAQVWVTLTADDQAVRLEVRDDGQGFDPSLALPRVDGGAGLPGMRERAQVAHAELEIESAIGVGTTVRLTLPLDRKQTGRRRIGSDTPGSGAQ